MRHVAKNNGFWLHATLLSLLMVASAPAAETSLDIGFGATAGVGVQAGLTLDHFTRDVPLSLRLSGAYSGRKAGHALDARQVFINDTVNGTPDETANTWQARLDLLYPLTLLDNVPMQIGVGIRRAAFTGTFNYIGGNEKFDVSSDTWGVGLILDAAFAISDRADFTLQAGIDHFFDAPLEGHDTTYDPDGDHINPRDGYDFSSADDAINQPLLEFYGLIGLRLRLGG